MHIPKRNARFNLFIDEEVHICSQENAERLGIMILDEIVEVCYMRGRFTFTCDHAISDT